MSKKELLAELENMGLLESSHIRQAFITVDRKDFLPLEHQNNFYANEALAIGYGQTNSQPLTVAFMLKLLQVQRGHKVLDVGSGSGWTTALLAFLAGDEGEVTGVEIIEELVATGQKNLAIYDFKNVKIIQAKVGVFGIPEKKFDRILVSAAYHEVPPELLEQLEIGGIMVLPVDSSIFKIVRKSATDFHKEEYFGFNFVPLVKSSDRS